MPKLVTPSRSGVHRFACLALYRALLRQCSPSTGSQPWLAETKSLVMERFRRYRQLQSPSQAANALKAGYKTLDLLDSASIGNKQGSDQISTILAQAKSVKEQFAAQQRKKAKVKKPLSPLEERKLETLRSELETWERNADSPSVLTRPRPINGKRKVPVLVSARGVPFLRIKKPQPKNLSGVIRNKLEKRWHRIEVRERLQADLLFAKDEDVWDRMTDTKDEGAWAEEPKLALDDICEKIRESDRKNRELAESMWKVVLKEREALVEEEKGRQART